MAYAHMYVQTRMQICVHLCFALEQNMTDLNATTHTSTYAWGSGYEQKDRHKQQNFNRQKKHTLFHSLQ